MKTSSSKKHLWIPAVVGATAILGLASANAAFVPLADDQSEFDPLGRLGAGTTGLAGTVIASKEVNWVGTIVNPSTYQGTLRSMVVDNGAGYDFYYQVINTSISGVLGQEIENRGNDIWRIGIPGYPLTDPTYPVSATYRTDGLAGLTLDALSSTWTGNISNNAGGGQVFSADRDAAMDTEDFFGGGTAFDFDASQFANLNGNPSGPEFGATTAPDNIEAGERSNWLVIRTNYTSFQVIDVTQISSGGGTGLASSFAPIPEPSTVLFGLAMLGVCAGGRLRKARAA